MQIVKRTFFKFFIYLFLNIQMCNSRQSRPFNRADISVIDFNVADIFNSDLTPLQIVTDQLSHMFDINYNGSEQMSTQTPEWLCFNTTDLSAAIKAMRYHRHMMNEYLISGYLSKEIVGSLSNTANIFEPSIEKRSGKAKHNSYADNMDAKSDANVMPTNHKLIEDEGSSQYSTWLKSINTFKDIQEQLLNKGTQDNYHGKRKIENRRQSLNINLEPMYGETDTNDALEYLEDGDITGYAFSNSPTEQILPFNMYRNYPKSLIEGKTGSLLKEATNKAGYDNSYDDYTAHPGPNFVSAASPKQTKEIGLKDITDIALTTLAFLSFGMFILQVLMCITMGKDDTTNMVMLPMEGTDNGDIPGDDNTEEIRRKRRSIPSTHMRNIDVGRDHLIEFALGLLKAYLAIICTTFVK